MQKKMNLLFVAEAYEIAKYFDDNHDYQLSEYIMAILSDTNTFVPQIEGNSNVFVKKLIYLVDHYHCLR